MEAHLELPGKVNVLFIAHEIVSTTAKSAEEIFNQILLPGSRSKLAKCLFKTFAVCSDFPEGIAVPLKTIVSTWRQKVNMKRWKLQKLG